jgi:hypothetical protein
VDPSYSYARAFRGVLAFRRGEYALAKQYLDDFEANDASPDARSVIEQQQLAERIDEALAAEGSGTTVPVSTLPTNTTSTTTPTTTVPTTTSGG